MTVEEQATFDAMVKALKSIQRWLMFTKKIPQNERSFWAKNFIKANELTVDALHAAWAKGRESE